MKKIIVIILVIATILNIIAGAFIFLDIQAMNIPETTLSIKVINITADEAVIQAVLSVNNQNSFSIFLQNVTMITSLETGTVINHLSVEGGETKAHENRSYSALAILRFNDSLPNELTSKITGSFGVNFLGFIKKTFPITVSMVVSLNNILEQFTLPQIHLATNISEITQEGVNLTGYIEIKNPNSIDIVIEDLSLGVETEKGVQVGAITIQGKTIAANTSQKLTGSGWLLLKALDAEKLQMTLNGAVTIVAAGIRKHMNLSVDADIVPPRLEQLLSDLPTDASLTARYKYTFREGLHDDITFEVINPTKLTLLITDITVKIYRIDRNKTRLISNGTLDDGVIASQNTTRIKGDMYIPLLQLWPRLGERFIPDRLQLILRANVTVKGLNQTIWIGMIGYQDFLLHWF
jgi:LEA14-like dessication related protein